jgi:hypothetical protein
MRIEGDSPAWRPSEVPNSPRRVAPLHLVDTADIDDWMALGIVLLDDYDPPIYGLADAALKAGLSGWYGAREVLVTDGGVLTHTRTEQVAPHFPCSS